MSWHYPYPDLIQGTLVKRYKRFLADIVLDSGETVTAHCPNTGPMTGVSQVGSAVLLSQSDNPKRKLAYTWEAIQTAGVWVGVNTALPNRVVKSALTARVIDALGAYDKVQSEVPYGEDRKSRVDFLLTAAGQPPAYVEVKNTTWTDKDRGKGAIALFPDTVTTRGQKHLRELTRLLPETRAVMLYFINREDCTQFSPGDTADPEYGKLLRAGVDQGLEVLPCRFEVTPSGIRYLGLAELAL
ncbi:MAG: DNA/RNA nuclease SfsA [Elainellaceae cyanobacterium]